MESDNADVCRPRRDWLAGLLHTSLFVFPLLTVVVGQCCRWSVGDPIDWNGESLGARLLDTILSTHLLYAAALLLLMRGRRFATLILSLITLPISIGVNMWCWLDVTGQYL